jgi:hypothetical protein
MSGKEPLYRHFPTTFFPFSSIAKSTILIGYSTCDVTDHMTTRHASSGATRVEKKDGGKHFVFQSLEGFLHKILFLESQKDNKNRPWRVLMVRSKI